MTMVGKEWTGAEVGQLKRGVIPEGRNRPGARCVAKRLGLYIPGIRERINHWTAEELKLLQRHEIPQGRTKNQCIQACRNHGIPPTGERWKTTNQGDEKNGI